MKIGFVCTNYNNSAYTRQAVESLYDGSRPRDVHVVVVDNNSRGEDIASLKALAQDFPRVDLMLNSNNIGYFSGLNVGIRQLKTTLPEVEHLVIGNNDLVFPKTFVETVEQHRDVLDTWAVVAPDLVTPEGIHQNPHVLHPISTFRRLVWNLYYRSFGAAVLIRFAANISKRFTTREENSPSSQLYRTAGPIEQGYGACYLLGPEFFRHFQQLYAPTFLMQEEYFLYEQLKGIGQLTYYDPRFLVYHQGHATTDQLPSRRHWEISSDAHRTYRHFRRMPAAERQRVLTEASQAPD